MQTAITIVSLSFLLWAIYSVVAIVAPMRPFTSRLSAVRSLGVSICAFMLSALAVGMAIEREAGQHSADPAPDSEQVQPPGAASAAQAPDQKATLRVAVVADGAIPAACGDGGLATMDVVAVSGSHRLRRAPETGAPLLKNEKASRILGKTHYHQIDPSTTVKRLCDQGDWAEVRITEPEWLRHVAGWVPSEALRGIERSADGARIYVEEDIYWDDDTRPFKAQIVTVLNRIARENHKCGQIDTYSVAKSPSRSTAGDTVFFVTCVPGRQALDAFNVWFRAADAAASASFAATPPLDRAAAVSACEGAARQAAMHPSTVSFSRVWDLSYSAMPSGRARVVSSFTAKNALNLELKYRINCLFDGATLIETQIAEHRG